MPLLIADRPPGERSSLDGTAARGRFSPASMRLALALTVTVALFTGCGSPCQDLADRICGCRAAGILQDNCKTAVKNQLGSGSPTPGNADEQYCQEKLKTCVDLPTAALCDRIATTQGKIDCGLAYPAPPAP